MSKLPQKDAHKRITMFLTDLLELGYYLTVKNDGKIVWCDSVDEDILIVPDKNVSAKTLYVYDINIQDPNAIVLNPINETTVASQDQIWFYRSINRILQNTFGKILRAIVDTSIEAKKNVEVLKDPTIAHFLSPFVNEIDEKMKTEINLITNDDNIKKVIYITYSKKTQDCALYTLFQDKEQEFIKSFGSKIRKKFWTTLEKIFQEIFSKENIVSEKPIYMVKKEGQHTCPRFVTYIDVVIYVWKAMLPFYPLIYDNEDDVDGIVDRIQNSSRNLEDFEDFYKVCIWSGTSINQSDDISDNLKSGPRTAVLLKNQETKQPSIFDMLGVGRPSNFQNNAYTPSMDIISPDTPEWKRNLIANQNNPAPLPFNNYNNFNNNYNNGYNNYNIGFQRNLMIDNPYDRGFGSPNVNRYLI